MVPFRTFFLIVLASGAALSARSVAAVDDCRKPYVVPYAEQCGFAYRSLKKDTSPANLAASFAACARAQNVAVSCVKSTDRTLHAVALDALFRDVTQQAEIAMFAQQFSVARALLREKLQVLDVVVADAKRTDPVVSRERASTEIDLKDASAGECAVTATASGTRQRELARARKYAELAALLKTKSEAYGQCAKLAATPAKRAYIEYVGLVALEEGGRASQASGATGDAGQLYRICIAGADRSAAYAIAPVKGYLKTVSTLCAGRASGRYRVDSPEPLDAVDANKFKPLTLPAG